MKVKIGYASLLISITLFAGLISSSAGLSLMQANIFAEPQPKFIEVGGSTVFNVTRTYAVGFEWFGKLV